MENFSLAQKIQIGLLGLCALLLIAQLSGVFNSSDSDLRNQAATELQATGANGAIVPGQPGQSGQPVIQPTQPIQPTTPPVPSGPKTKMAFGESTYNFGTVSEGEKVEHIYKFKNSGNEPLIISNAQGSCGCTVPQWPKEPIAPGKSGEIKVVFDSKGKAGKQSKTVTITANTDPATTTINIEGEVLKVAGAADATSKPVTPIQVNPGGGK
ncbi:MAG: DUF1573 domain-containing protein [Saprospiraceae bacterium]|nr:DUF1573 domain-containing protein [Saprospiraceae bacterium]